MFIKKLLCVLLAVLTLMLLPLQVSAQGEGFENEPAVTANGANGTTMKTEWNAENKKLTLTVISNGMVTMNIKE